MQCYSDLNLQCCDCSSTFTSASKLLQHFADHALKNVKIKLKNDILSNARRKKRDNSQVSIVQPESSGSESSPSRQESTLSAMSDSCSESSTHDQPQSCKLAKFDLQKRLESCVSNFGIKQESDSSYHSETSIKQEPEENISPDSPVLSPDIKCSEEYSPLKFCMITMSEEDDNTKTGVNNSPKKVASRKQLLPKKIERKVEGLRNLAPKPENAVSSSELVLQYPGKKKYACHLCTKVFGWSTDLKRHILVHTGERPFKCKTCQATFTRNFLLQKHQSKVHPCKPKESIIKPEIVDMPSTIVTNSDDDEKIDPLKGEPAYNDDEDDEDEDKLVITDDIDDKSPNSLLSNCSSDSKWHVMPANSDRWCSDLKQSEMFGITPIKVLTM